MRTKTLTVALVGNPNTGKSTLFNALSGLRQHVGNYPGVTVEMKKGRASVGELTLDLIDLPGTYSLAARSPDEMVAVDLLLGRRPEEPKPDAVVSVVDASNLDRHLYLTSQLLDLGVPVVVAVNMLDVAKAQGIAVDCAALADRLGVPVVGVQANKGVGLDALKAAVAAAAAGGVPPQGPRMPVEFEKEVAGLQAELGPGVHPVLTRRMLLDVGGYVEKWLYDHHGNGLKAAVESARGRLLEAGHGVPGVEARARFGWVRPVVAAAVTKPTVRAVTRTDKLDAVLTHKLWGTLVFLAMMALVFQSIFYWAKPLMELIDAGRESLSGVVEGSMDPGPLRALVVDGILSGVGSVLIFLPQILILFAFVAILEDCGYMARAAFLMDRLMSRCGLSGKSFIPLLSSVACAVPGIMATRVIENRRDRLTTILVAPLMSCSARLPVYILLIGAFLKDGFPTWLPGVVLFGMYMVGFVVAPLVALVLKRTLLRGDTPVFVMELPGYKLPTLRGIARRAGDAGWAFVRRAGTVIFAAMILVWALLYFPAADANGVLYADREEAADRKVKAAGEPVTKLKEAKEPVPEELEKALADAEGELNAVKGEQNRRSYLGRAGLALEPIFTPLGWDWKIGMAALASFPAREVIVGTFGLVYDAGKVDPKLIADDQDETAIGFKKTLQSEWAADPVRGKYGVAVALSVLVFFALCCQCASTLAIIRRETKSWAWPAFTFTYMTVLAYVGAFATFQIGRLITNAVT